jgi:hypothetical protein
LLTGTAAWQAAAYRNQEFNSLPGFFKAASLAQARRPRAGIARALLTARQRANHSRGRVDAAYNAAVACLRGRQCIFSCNCSLEWNYFIVDRFWIIYKCYNGSIAFEFRNSRNCPRNCSISVSMASRQILRKPVS